MITASQAPSWITSRFYLRQQITDFKAPSRTTDSHIWSSYLLMTFWHSMKHFILVLYQVSWLKAVTQTEYHRQREGGRQGEMIHISIINRPFWTLWSEEQAMLLDNSFILTHIIANSGWAQNNTTSALSSPSPLVVSIYIYIINYTSFI